jgi:hypothetical protein
MDCFGLSNGGPNGNRTRVSGVRGQRPRPLDDGTIENKKLILEKSQEVSPDFSNEKSMVGGGGFEPP